MAYVDENLLDDELDQENGGPTNAATAAASTARPATAGQIAKRGSGNFADLGEYLRVNKPLEFGQQVAGKIGDEIGKADETVTGAETEFKSRVDANTVRDTDDLAGKLATDPRQVDKDQFARLRDAEYKGPASLADSKDISSRVRGSTGAALGKANASQTEGGRFALLDNYFGRPQYTQGEKTLDNLLIQNDPGSKDAFQQMRDNASAVSKKAEQLPASTLSYAAQGAQATRDARQGARGALGIDDSGNPTNSGAIGTARSDLAKRTSDMNAQRAQQFQQAKTIAGQNKFGLTPEFLEAMGVTGDRGYGVDPTQFLTQGQTLADRQVATADDAARFRALEELAGGNLSMLDDYSQVGSAANSPAYNFNKQGYQGTVANEKAAYQSASSQNQAQAASLQQQINAILSDNNMMKDPWEREAQAAPYIAQLNELKRQKALLDQKYLGGPISMDAFVNARH